MVVVNGDVQITASDRHIGVSRGITDLSKRSPASQRVADERVPPVVDRQGLEAHPAGGPERLPQRVSGERDGSAPRLFCHVTHSLQAVVLKTIEIVRDFIARTTTALGLRVFAEIATQT